MLAESTLILGTLPYSDLVGKQGVVKGAQTLGGWHEVLLDVSILVN